MRDEKGVSKVLKFVCFSTPEEANKAVTSFHGFMFHGKRIYVAIAQRKEERQAQLQLQYAQRVVGLAEGQPAVFSGGYPPYYYTAPGIIPQVSPRPGLMYQPMAMNGGLMAFHLHKDQLFNRLMSQLCQTIQDKIGKIGEGQMAICIYKVVLTMCHVPQLLVSSNEASNHQVNC